MSAVVGSHLDDCLPNFGGESAEIVETHRLDVVRISKLTKEWAIFKEIYAVLWVNVLRHTVSRSLYTRAFPAQPSPARASIP